MSKEYKMPELENINVAFEEMANHTEKFLRKYGNPHTTVIADQRGIEVLQGTKAKSFELNDDIEFTDTINFVETSEPDKVANILNDLQHRLEVAEKAFELACDYLVSVEGDELFELCKYIYNNEDDLKVKMNYFKEQAEKEVGGDKNERN